MKLKTSPEDMCRDVSVDNVDPNKLQQGHRSRSFLSDAQIRPTSPRVKRCRVNGALGKKDGGGGGEVSGGRLSIKEIDSRVHDLLHSG